MSGEYCRDGVALERRANIRPRFIIMLRLALITWEDVFIASKNGPNK